MDYETIFIVKSDSIIFMAFARKDLAQNRADKITKSGIWGNVYVETCTYYPCEEES